MNYKHLHYFWVAAKAGGIVRAGQQLHTSPQTLSGQIKLLEERLGRKLFRKRGRQLELTDDGRVALAYADEIFALGGELEASLRGAPGAPQTLDFRVGIADSVPKSLACRLLEPGLDVAEPVRLVCHEGKFEDLLSQLAVHRLDLVLADAPLPRQAGVKAFNHVLGQTAMSFLCTRQLRATLKGRFPECLNGAPLLVQGATSALRRQLEDWLVKHRLQPRIVGEFDDPALMKAFARQGHGVFASPTVLEAETQAQYGVVALARTDELQESFYAISPERRISHPCVAAIAGAARDRLFHHA